MCKNFALFGAFIALMLFGAFISNADEKKHEHGEKGEHKAAHGGCLNAIGTCENGHVEVKLEGDLIKFWLVGGGTDTDKAVRIPDKELSLSVTLDGEKEPRNLMLKAKPNELAEEKEGDCSSFEGKAEWLKNAKKFIATATINFKGKKQELKIEYPAGYDPDEE